ncbi:MAG: tetratricopeptide repeat protein [Treponema sp.]|nr:tetratricopeptide repeat protein [Treponema sp.]
MKNSRNKEIIKGKLFFLVLFSIFISLFSSCGVSNKSIQRQIKIEEGVSNPLTIEELKDAIGKYQTRVAEQQLAMSQIGMWYRLLGTRYVDSKMYGEALKCFQEALKYYPNNQNLYYYVGLCAGYMSHAALDFGGTGSHEQKYNYLKLSEEAYLRALEIDGRYTNAMYGLAVLYVFELDESEKAVPLLEKLLSIDTRHTDAMFVLARAYYSCLNFEKSVEMYDKIIATTKSPDKLADAENNKRIVLEASYGN